MERILILGMGLSGQSAIKRLIAQGYRHFLIVDKKKSAIESEGIDVRFLIDSQELQVKDFEEITRCILSPGVGPDSPAYQLMLQLKIPFEGEMEFGLQGLRGKKVLVTGSNGKSTCVTLAAHLLKSAGYEAAAVGNIGVPLSGIEKSSDEMIWIVEASSFQMETLHTQAFDIGVILNITENHLDRHKEMIHYAKAKALLQRGLKKEGELWVDDASFQRFRSLWTHPICRIWDAPEFWKELTCGILTDEIVDKQIAAKLKTDYKCELSHDVGNVKVALAIAQKLGLPLDRALEGLGSYKKLPYRLQVVRRQGLIEFVNDSKSTSVASTRHALQTVPGPLVLIAGGVHKGASYEPWREALRAKGLGVCVMGKASEVIVNDLQGVCPIQACTSLNEAVACAYEWLKNSSQPGTKSVLFSPGCSSYDMFINFEDRGRKFEVCVDELIARGDR